MKILSVDTTTSICSVSIRIDGILIFDIFLNIKNSHSENLLEMIKFALCKSNLELSQIDYFGISKGPGSYTGLRIGFSTMYGLCFALKKKLIGIDTLESMIFDVKKNIRHNDEFDLIAMIDAKKERVYTKHYDSFKGEFTDTKFINLDRNFFEKIKKKTYFLGNGTIYLKENGFDKKNIEVLEEINPKSCIVAEMIEKKILSKKYENIADAEPLYLKKKL